jgi:SagB-type dehydrogenase family enzyme
MEREKERTLAARELLRTRWADVDFEKTDQALKIPAPPQQKPYDPRGSLVGLPSRGEWKIPGLSVLGAILGRRSRRKFRPEALSLEELAFLLYSTQGIEKLNKAYSFRTVPSGGARHAFETYVYADRVEDLPKGLYRYLPIEHKLYQERPFSEGMAQDLDTATEGQLWGAAAYFIWTTLPYRMEWRYSFASAKIIAIDAGHVCQNLYLACEAIGCGTCGIGAYRQDLVDKFLGVDGVEEFALYMAPVGKAVAASGGPQ